MASRSLNLLSSYRVQIVIFTTVILLITIVSLYYLGRHLEGRIISLVEEHIQEVSLAVDLAQTSFPSEQYLYELVPQDGRLSVGLDESHIIHRILVADADGRILDSVERGDLGKTLDEVLGDLSPQKPAVIKHAASTAEHEPDKVLSYPIETEKGIRRVIIIISPHHLGEVVRKESRERLIAIGVLGLLLIAIIRSATVFLRLRPRRWGLVER